MREGQVYDTLVCEAVRRDPLKFVDILNQEAETAGSLEPLLREAACIIANLLLNDEEWHKHKKINANRLLTLEELREMDGEPVWVEDLLIPIIPKCSMYHFAQNIAGEILLIEPQDYPSRDGAVPHFGTDDASRYGKTWMAYRHKPEGVSDD